MRNDPGQPLALVPPSSHPPPQPHLAARGPGPPAQALTELPTQRDAVHRSVLGLLAPVLQRRLDAETGSGRRGGTGPGPSPPPVPRGLKRAF